MSISSNVMCSSPEESQFERACLNGVKAETKTMVMAIWEILMSKSFVQPP